LLDRAGFGEDLLMLNNITPHSRKTPSISVNDFLKSSLRPQVLVVGDSMLDVYVDGTVERISPEAPVPVVRRVSTKSVPGGAANVAANVSSLGGTARLVSFAGNDPSGNALARLLADADVTAKFMLGAHFPTITKTRYVAGQHQLLRVDHEEQLVLTSDMEDEILRQVELDIQWSDSVIVSDYNKGFLTDRILRSLISIATSAGRPVLVDPKRADFSGYAGATLIKPNRHELKVATGLPTDEDGDAEKAAAIVTRSTGASVLMTRSERGMSLFQPNSRPIHMPTLAKQVFDVSGAGDTVIAAVAVASSAGVLLEEAISFANAAARVAVSKVGTAAVRKNEVHSIVLTQEGLSIERGALVSLEAAENCVQEWRRQGLTVGFTNGCFDLVHPGHVSLLQDAARHCDKLIVGLNSDGSVRRLKGPTRPLQHEAARAAVIGSMACVSLVVLFEEDTPIDVIRRLSPDLLVKGGDYNEDEIVGAQLVKSSGGQVRIVGYLDGHSTTGLVRKSNGQLH
jgi:D-beta-D-heptose 7-phosphate kinase / D-beta-D-heptose 1-phosphate adenosyltransferase